jgi:hypothetical protein
LTRKYLLLVSSVLLLSSMGLAQSRSFQYPPEQLLARIRPEGIRAQMEFLADDLLEGRGTGTRGYQLAANYVRAQFEEMGLKPGGENGTYFQNVRFRKVDLVREQSTLKLKVNGTERTLAQDHDYLLRGDALSTNSTAEGQVTYVGYGVTAPEHAYDDYAGVDVRGKIVLAFYGSPERFPSAPGAHYSSGEVKLANAAAHGAIGMLQIWGGKQEERIPFQRLVRFFRQPSLRWLDAKGSPNDPQPTIHGSAWVSSATAATLFENSGHPWKDVQAAALDGKAVAIPLSVTATIHVVSQHSEVASPNIAAILPGSDAQLKNEYVVYSAHLDHLGIGDPVNGDSIYNGAADNASGTAALLEIARALSSAPVAPRRSIVFLAVTGEEENLLGSDYYAHQPTVPMSQIVANVNMDEISLLYDFKDIVPLGAEHSSLGAIVDDVAQHMGLAVSPDPAPEEVYFIRSDQYSFVKQGVPSVYVGEGYQTVDPKLNGKKISDAWEATRYHTPSDDMNQPLDFNAAAKCTRVDLAIGYEIAQDGERPRWNAGDFFEKFAGKTAAGGH